MNTMEKTIFLVDDDITNLTLGRKALGNYYDLFTIDSGKRLFDVLQRIMPDLILLDLEMPEMSGYEVIRRLKDNPATADIPVIFLTSRDNEEAEVEGFDLGAVDYILKPLSPMRVLKRVASCLLAEEQKLALRNYNSNLEKMVAIRTLEITELKNALIKTMAEIVEHRDHFTGSHITRTQKYIQILLKTLKTSGIYSDELVSIDEQLAIQSSSLHDVGKIAIKDSILMKPDKLTESEYEEMKTHAAYGGKIISQIKMGVGNSNFLEYARIFAIYHHERWDGRGYPHGLRGENIPLLGRVMAIADVYDALVTERPYKRAFPHDEAVRIMREASGSMFDPALIALFVQVNEEFEAISGLHHLNRVLP